MLRAKVKNSKALTAIQTVLGLAIRTVRFEIAVSRQRRPPSRVTFA